VWAHDHVGAIIQAFYPGEEGGSALAEILFGDVSPAGRLPITFPRSLADVPDFKDYSMKGRTYRYLGKLRSIPLATAFPTRALSYQDLAVSPAPIPAGAGASVSVTVKNVGSRPSDEVVQLYLTDIEASCRVPLHSLRGFLACTSSCPARPAVSRSRFLRAIFRSLTSAAFACWSRADSASAWAAASRIRAARS